jgi:hypothetical protein
MEMITKPWTAICLAAATLVVSAPSRAQLLFSAAQGSTRSISSEAVSITSLNGAPAFIAATTQRPFVIGLVPVVGDYGGAAAPVYGPAALMPRYNPGPSVLEERIARLKQSGGVRAFSPREAAVAPLSAPKAQSELDAFQKRLAAARRSSAGTSVESIASIRSRQARNDESTGRDTAALQIKMREAENAGKLQLARLYQREIERLSTAAEAAVSPSLK